jgi:hypothetical protein
MNSVQELDSGNFLEDAYARQAQPHVGRDRELTPVYWAAPAATYGAVPLRVPVGSNLGTSLVHHRGGCVITK